MQPKIKEPRGHTSLVQVFEKQDKILFRRILGIQFNYDQRKEKKGLKGKTECLTIKKHGGRPLRWENWSDEINLSFLGYRTLINEE